MFHLIVYIFSDLHLAVERQRFGGRCVYRHAGVRAQDPGGEEHAAGGGRVQIRGPHEIPGEPPNPVPRGQGHEDRSGWNIIIIDEIKLLKKTWLFFLRRRNPLPSY